MRSVSRAVFALLAAAMALAAQAPLPPRAEPQAVEITSPGAILSYRTRGSTNVELRGTERAPAAIAGAKIEPRSGYFEIEFRRGGFSGLGDPAGHGSDYLTYVLWVVPPGGAAMRAGEITFDDNRSNSLRITTAAQAFWLMVTAEPDFAVYEPSPAVVLVSQASEQATAVPGPLLYYTHYTAYAAGGGSSAVGELDLLQARKAVEFASGAQLAEAVAEAPPDTVRAGEVLRLAEAYLGQAESELQARGASEAFIQYARTAVGLAEDSRALSLGVAGRLTAHQLRLRDQRVAAAEQELAALRDRFAQLEATLDRERHHSRELESDILSLRERVTSLEGGVERAQATTARLEEQRAQACRELRLQLGALGHLGEKDGAVVLDLASDVLFESGRFEVRSAARESLGRLASIRTLIFSRAGLRAEGHTDLVGEEDYNQWLSEQRALSVYRYFLEDALGRALEDQRYQMEADLSVVEQLLKMNYNAARRQATERQELLARLEGRVVGKGMREPMVPEKGPNEKNRRVTLVFFPLQPDAPVSPCPAGELTE
ncbi:MAG: OmpA family protein [Acidobacteria bacterium]|nr:OmpA family protein [Acidobacteriota bacterium]